MALVGGGGAGNTAGSNPSGTGAGLNFVGSHAYAYSGEITSAGGGSADTTYLDFTMPNNTYAEGWLYLSTFGAGSGERFFTVSIDDQIVINIKQDGNPDFLNNFPIPLLFPNDAHVEVKAGTSGGEIFAITFRGRAYA